MFLSENAEPHNVEDLQLTEANQELLTEMFNQMDADVSMLTESSKKQSRKSVFKRRVTRAANMLAKQSGDPLYDKMQKHYEALMEIRASIQAKYSNKATQVVKQASK